jgi:murein DD-endopeptidase MepM/ murein hydrolase activator NlpD
MDRGATVSGLLCYPHPSGLGLHRPPYGDLHQTAGLPGNWALDFMAPGGTPLLAPQDATVTRWSGHDPSEGVLDGDIFGLSMYLRTVGGVSYFATHLGDRVASVGRKVKRGDLLGHVGHWPNDPGRSHTHLGVTHPMGRRASVYRIENVAKAPMLPFPPL